MTNVERCKKRTEQCAREGVAMEPGDCFVVDRRYEGENSAGHIMGPYRAENAVKAAAQLNDYVERNAPKEGAPFYVVEAPA